MRCYAPAQFITERRPWRRFDNRLHTYSITPNPNERFRIPSGLAKEVRALSGTRRTRIPVFDRRPIPRQAWSRPGKTPPNSLCRAVSSGRLTKLQLLAALIGALTCTSSTTPARITAMRLERVRSVRALTWIRCSSDCLPNLRIDLRRISSSPTRCLLGHLPKSQIEKIFSKIVTGSAIHSARAHSPIMNLACMSGAGGGEARVRRAHCFASCSNVSLSITSYLTKP